MLGKTKINASVCTRQKFLDVGIQSSNTILKMSRKIRRIVALSVLTVLGLVFFNNQSAFLQQSHEIKSQRITKKLFGYMGFISQLLKNNTSQNANERSSVRIYVAQNFSGIPVTNERFLSRCSVKVITVLKISDFVSVLR